MKFLSYRKKSTRLVLIGMVSVMLFGLIGCGNRKQTTCEEIAQTYLKKKYHKEFVVEELSKKDAGPFRTEEYSGFAYEKDDPLMRFKVWVGSDKKTVSDAYYSVQLLPDIHDWLQSEADRIWAQAKTAVLLDVLRCNPNPSYASGDYRAFYKNESVESTVYLFICENDLSVEQYIEFDAAIGEMTEGYVQVYCLNEEEFGVLQVNEHIHDTPDYSIRIGASKTVIENKIHQGR